jgi:hypothetical protein
MLGLHVAGRGCGAMRFLPALAESAFGVSGLVWSGTEVRESVDQITETVKARNMELDGQYGDSLLTTEIVCYWTRRGWSPGS